MFRADLKATKQIRQTDGSIIDEPAWFWGNLEPTGQLGRARSMALIGRMPTESGSARSADRVAASSARLASRSW